MAYSVVDKSGGYLNISHLTLLTLFFSALALNLFAASVYFKAKRDNHSYQEAFKKAHALDLKLKHLPDRKPRLITTHSHKLGTFELKDDQQQTRSANELISQLLEQTSLEVKNLELKQNKLGELQLVDLTLKDQESI